MRPEWSEGQATHEDQGSHAENAAGRMVTANSVKWEWVWDNVALAANGREWKRPEGHREAEEHTALGIKVGIILKNHAELPESLNRVWSDLGLKKNTQIM